MVRIIFNCVVLRIDLALDVGSHFVLHTENIHGDTQEAAKEKEEEKKTFALGIVSKIWPFFMDFLPIVATWAQLIGIFHRVSKWK